jgi:DNA-binding CsgD family transcriptional regulator
MDRSGLNECFVAREGELSVLHGALRDARDGSPAIVAVEGEPGIGKTTLLRRFLAEVPDTEILWASGDETEVSLDHGVSSQLWDAMPSDLDVAGGPAFPGSASGSDGFAMGAALLASLGTLQERGVVVIVVDDLQWADLPSARALLFAVRRLRRDNVLVLLTSRPHSLARLGDSWLRLLSQQGQRLRLGGLSPTDLRPLASTLFGLELSPTVRDRLCEHTGGNPLYVRTLLEELPASALTDTRGPLPAPHSYAATVMTRIARMSDSAQHLLEAGSVAGRHFPLLVAAGAAGIDDVAAAFDEACAARLLTSVMRAGHEEATFTHPLVRAAIYNDLSTARRRHFHLAVARFVPRPASLGHRVAAAQGADDELGTELVAMAESDIAAGELPNAAQRLLAAGRLAAGRARREDCLLRAVELLLMSGAADAHDHLDAVWRCADGARKRFVLACLTAAAGQVGAASKQLESLLQDLRFPGDRAVLGPAAASLAMFCSMRGRTADAMRWAATALETAGDDPGVSMTARQVLASALAMAGRTPEALALLAWLSPAQVIPRPYEAELLATRGSLKASAGDFAGAVKDLTAVVRWSRAGATLRSLPDSYAALAQAEYGLGAWDDAANHAELAVSLAQDLGHFWFLAQAHKVAVDIYSSRGDWQFAREHVAGARRAAREMDVPGEVASASVAAATLAWAQGAWDAVLGALAPLHEGDLKVLTANFDPVSWRLREAEAFLATGQLAEAAGTLAGTETASAQPPAIALDIHRLRAQLALAQGRPKEARASFTAGLDVAAEAEHTLGHALLAIAYGRFLRTDGRRREAIQQLRTAHDVLSALGARPFLAACDAELSACGVHLSGPPAAENPHGLTAREQGVARLVAEGLSNREAAAELFLSAKAIEYHLANIFAKLGITSRRQLRTALMLPQSPAPSRHGALSPEADGGLPSAARGWPPVAKDTGTAEVR